jgi:hypothetical protein
MAQQHCHPFKANSSIDQVLRESMPGNVQGHIFYVRSFPNSFYN